MPIRLRAAGSPLSVSFDGTALTAYPGETLAAALVADGRQVLSQGIYTGRPGG